MLSVLEMVAEVWFSAQKTRGPGPASRLPPSPGTSQGLAEAWPETGQSLAGVWQVRWSRSVGHTDGGTDGPSDELSDRWQVRPMAGRTVGRSDGQMVGWIIARTVGLTFGGLPLNLRFSHDISKFNNDSLVSA